MTRGKRTYILAATAVFAVTASTAIGAGPRKVVQKGTVAGDHGAAVRLVVVKDGGTPKSVKAVKLANLLADCENGPDRIELRLFGAAKVDPADRTFERTYGSKHEGIVKIAGKVSRKGDRVQASILGSKVNVLTVGLCEVPSVDLRTKR